MKNNNSIQTTVTANIATITLNRPEIHNAFDDEFIKQLTNVLVEVNEDSQIRVVILAANGKSFCAGADISWMQKMTNYSREENLQDARVLAFLMRTLNELNKPVIALVQGAAYGGGVGLVACCDIAIASSEASFCFSEVKIGLVPAVISPYAIRAIGERAARRYFLTAEKFSAAEAYRLGLVHRVVEPNQLKAIGDKIAQVLLSNGPHAVTTTKQLIATVSQHPIDDSIQQITAECIADIRVSPQGQEGLRAFLEKRPPKFSDP